MTRIDQKTIATDLNDDAGNADLIAQGYSIRHIETYHRDQDYSAIIWDWPGIEEHDLPY